MLNVSRPVRVHERHDNEERGDGGDERRAAYSWHGGGYFFDAMLVPIPIINVLAIAAMI